MRKTKKDIIEEISQHNAILPLPAEPATYSTIDPEYQTLKDIIESAKIENWDCKIGYNINLESYEVDLTNITKTLCLRSRLRLYKSDEEKIYIGGVRVDINTNGIKSNTIFDADLPIVKFLLTKFLWDYVLDYHEKMRAKEINEYVNLKNAIYEQLKTLTRDNKMNQLI